MNKPIKWFLIINITLSLLFIAHSLLFFTFFNDLLATADIYDAIMIENHFIYLFMTVRPIESGISHSYMLVNHNLIYASINLIISILFLLLFKNKKSSS